MNHETYDHVQRMALGFCLEDETWLAFLDWVLKQSTSPAADQWAYTVDVTSLRREWLRRSQMPLLRALADEL